MLLALLAALMLAACGDGGAPAETAVAGPTTAAATDPTIESQPTPTPTATAVPPTPTPVPAALVNGQPIRLTTFENELARYEQALAQLGQTPNSDARSLVLDALIERELIRQAASVEGVEITSAQLDTRLEALRTAADSNSGFDEWLEANLWTLEEFRQALAAEMLAEEMVARVTAEVPFTTEQVRARYIQLDDAQQAESILQQIREGGDLAALAAQFSLDQVTAQQGGDLGFFARGSLLVPQVEDAAFALEPGKVSEVIAVMGEGEGNVTYYIVQTIERDPDRPLPAELRQEQLQATFTAWLDELRQNSNILRLVE